MVLPRTLPARLRALVAAIGLLLAAGALGVPSAPRAAASASPAGLTLLHSVHADRRLLQLSFSTPALAAPTGVRVLLPADYATSGRRYPVLYLLHGAADNFKSWTDKGSAEKLTAGLPLIVVMPDGGMGGFYSDWFNRGAGGPPEWETYHIDQLLPWLDQHFRTIPNRAHRAVMGLSMGGFGAMSYAARHPDLFSAAASFSGAVDSNTAPIEAETIDGGIPGDTWGQRATDEVRWRAHNPWDLAANLRNTTLTVRTGNGRPGGPFGGGDPVEAAVWLDSMSFHKRLVALGIHHVWDDYGPGGHQWPYWARDLKETLPGLMRGFAHPAPAPRRFSYTAVEPSYSVYGWSVTLHRTALEFSALERADRRGFLLTGSGSARVTTAGYYRPGRSFRVSVSGPHQHSVTVLRADRSGRLSVPITLGPANAYQEYTPEAKAAGTAKFTAVVRVTRAA